MNNENFDEYSLPVSRGLTMYVPPKEIKDKIDALFAEAQQPKRPAIQVRPWQGESWKRKGKK